MWYSFLILHLVGLVGYNLVLRRSLSRRADASDTRSCLYRMEITTSL